MASSFVLYALAATICLLLSHFVAEARKERLEYVKTIKTEAGDIYDCVDFYKQPAFNHPLLKNHSFHPEMRPSSRPKRPIGNLSSTNHGEQMDMKFKEESCPPGTVPIRRMSKDNHLLRSQLLRQHFAQSRVVNTDEDQSEPQTYIAVAQTKGSMPKVYNGIAATMAVYNPHVEPSQYSSGEIMIKGASDLIVAGWTVNPMVYKDNQTRFFIYASAKESHCFDSVCGFVIVNTDIHLDAPLRPVSKMGGPIYEYQVFVYQDAKNGNWWLEVGQDSTVVGFWPQTIFGGLYQSASYVACGGEAYGPGHPEMGTGFMNKAMDKENCAYCVDILVVDEAHNVVHANDHDLEVYSNHDKHYTIDMEKGLVIFGGPKLY